MKPRKKLLQKSRLYVILDKKTCANNSLSGIAKRIRDAGADIIQLRDKVSDKKSILKEALLLKKLLRNSKTLLIINDYPDLAKIADSDGVHLGQGDISIEIARLILGKDKIIGISCHNVSQAIKAQEQGADYLGIGPIFPTPTKPGCRAYGLKAIKEIKKRIRIPFFAIGNINPDNMLALTACGAKRVAVCRAIVKAKDISKSTKKILGLLN